MRAALIAIVLSACGGAAPAPAAREVAMPLPSLTLPRLTGGTWSSVSARGSVLVIDVWASWCKPCSKGFPKLDALAANGSNVVVVAISIDEDPAAIRDFIGRFPLAAPVAHDVDRVLVRPPLTIAELPTLLVVDTTGVIRYRIEEPTDTDYDQLGELVRRAASY